MDCRELRLVLFGLTGSGVSSTCNTFLGRHHFKTSTFVRSETSQCEVATGQRLGRNILTVDTPGVITNTRDFIGDVTTAIGLCSSGANVFVLVVKIEKFPMELMDVLRDVDESFGDGLFNRLIVTFTKADELEFEGTDFNMFVETFPPKLKELQSRVNNRFLTVNNRGTNEQKMVFCEKFFAMVDSMIENNVEKCYTMEAAMVSLQQRKQRKEEEKQQEDERLKKERDEIEASIKARHAKVLSDLLKDLRKLQQLRSQPIEYERSGCDMYTDLKLRNQNHHQPQQESRDQNHAENRVNTQKLIKIHEDIHMKEREIREMNSTGYLPEDLRLFGGFSERLKTVEEDIKRVIDQLMNNETKESHPSETSLPGSNPIPQVVVENVERHQLESEERARRELERQRAVEEEVAIFKKGIYEVVFDSETRVSSRVSLRMCNKGYHSS